MRHLLSLTAIVGLVALALSTSPARSIAGPPCSARDTVFFAETAIKGREEWYGAALRASGESRLCPGAGREVYRFLWLRTFDAPIVVRIENEGGRFALIAVVLTGAGGYDPGTIAATGRRSLSMEEMRQVRERITRAWFWQSPTVPPPSDVVGTDGAQWIVEGVDGERYHVVDRWSPTGQDPFRDLGLYFLRLGRLQIDSTEIY